MNKNRKWHLILLCAAAAVYFGWRVLYTVPTEDPAGLVIGTLVLLTEFTGFMELILHLWISVHALPRRRKPETKELPDVDVLVTACGEPLEILEETLRACVGIDYPAQKKHIYVCDDGADDNLKALAETLGVGYLRREDRAGAKAGNLNAALAVTDSPLVAVFDADMRPRPAFLNRTVPYMLGNFGKHGIRKLDDSVGFVQTPQCFDEPDLFQRACGPDAGIPNEQDYFYFSIEPSRNRINAVILAGTNMLLSRKALEDTGGFRQDTLTEDFATGIEIAKRGYRTIDLTDELAVGKVPHDLPSLISQRRRWARGCIASGMRTRFLGSKELDHKQKISYLLAILYWYFPLKRVLYLLGPILYVVAGIPVVNGSFLGMALIWLPYYLISSYEITSFSDRMRTPHLSRFYETCLTPFLFFPVLAETVGIRGSVFAVTDKSRTGRWSFRYLIPFIAATALHLAAIIVIITKDTAYLYKSAFMIFWLIYNLFELLTATAFILSCSSVPEQGNCPQGHRVGERYFLKINPVSILKNRLKNDV